MEITKTGTRLKKLPVSFGRVFVSYAFGRPTHLQVRFSFELITTQRQHKFIV